MRDIAFRVGVAGEESFGIDASPWFASMTKKINLLKEVEDAISTSSQAMAGEYRDAAFVSLITLSLIAGFATLGSLVMVYLIARSIVGPVGKTVAALEAVAASSARRNTTKLAGSTRAAQLAWNSSSSLRSVSWSGAAGWASSSSAQPSDWVQ